jgi:glutamate/tyrosine decarboxylase-like PLP-dependent enzyme
MVEWRRQSSNMKIVQIDPMKFPAKGLSRSSIQQKLEQLKKESHMDDSGIRRQFTDCYRLTGLPDLQELAKDTFGLFMESIPTFEHEEGVRRMEEEVISMLGGLWGADEAKGAMTTGGTESNAIALYAARNRAKNKRGSVIMPNTAHASFRKACTWLGLEPIVVPPADDFTANPEAMRKMIRRDTVAIVASCGSFPWAAIDPIQEIGKIAEENSLYFHVDAAFGGLLCPWLEGTKYGIPKWDFRIKGVSSISSDPHKQGFSIHPAGAIVFRDNELFESARWTETVSGYTSSGYTLSGSKSGSPIAITWAIFQYLGKNGYVRLSKKCMDLTMNFVQGVKKIPGLDTATNPKINMATAISTKLDMTPVKRELQKKGWFFFDIKGKPKTRENALMVEIVPYNEQNIPIFLKDLGEIASRVGTMK